MNAFKKVVKTMTKGSNSYILSDLDKWLMNDRGGQDRRFDINSPSCAGRCQRANYYSRVLTQNTVLIDPRLRRIFENGDGVHERLQTYFEKMGRMMMSEMPLIDDDYLIQGHTDGLITYANGERLAVLEIKSINDNGYNQLKAPKSEHIKQAMVYLHCAEKRRKYLRKTYLTAEDFKESLPERVKWAKKHYTHLKNGSRFTAKQKLNKKVRDHLLADEILYDCEFPIDVVVFIYENKNTQMIKEFGVDSDKKLTTEVLTDYSFLNKCVENENPPPRIGTKNSQACQYCDWKHDCWN